MVELPTVVPHSGPSLKFGFGWPWFTISGRF